MKFDIGTPVPIPDAEINFANNFATQQQLSEMSDAINTDEGSNTPIVDSPVLEISDDTPPAHFVPREKEPFPIKKIDPVYPEIARKANLEGQVWVRIWVDKEGKVRRAELLKSESEIFNQPALEAVRQWLFSPALQQGKPVDVWVALCFRFKLGVR
jgi:protein TonB